MKYLQRSFSTGANNDAYRNNFDAVFGHSGVTLTGSGDVVTETDKVSAYPRAEDRPVLFLDFDGVLNSGGPNGSRSRRPSGWNELDNDMVRRVNQIVNATGAEVVASTSWRLLERDHPDGARGRLTDILRSNGATFDLIDVTPRIDNCMHTSFDGRVMHECPWNRVCNRGMEIQIWLDSMGLRRPVCILDDSTDMAHLMPWLVRTFDDEGLQLRHAEQAIKLLLMQVGYTDGRPKVKVRP